MPVPNSRDGGYQKMGAPKPFLADPFFLLFRGSECVKYPYTIMFFLVIIQLKRCHSNGLFNPHMSKYLRAHDALHVVTALNILYLPEIQLQFHPQLNFNLLHCARKQQTVSGTG